MLRAGVESVLYIENAIMSKVYYQLLDELLMGAFIHSPFWLNDKQSNFILWKFTDSETLGYSSNKACSGLIIDMLKPHIPEDHPLKDHSKSELLDKFAKPKLSYFWNLTTLDTVRFVFKL